MKKLILMMSIVAGVTMFYSCNKDDDNSTNGSGDYSYKIRMTDAPGPYNAVNVDIQSVAIVDGNGKTVMLDAQAGVHNLLDLSNGTDILLASHNLENSKVSQIKLVLGSNNTVVVNNVSYPLSLSTSDMAGLTLNVNQALNAGVNNDILIDFDANSSVVSTGLSTYKLKPIIRSIDATITGSISGSVNNSSLAIVSATSTSGNTYTTGISSNGNFKLLGLSTGSYTLTVTPLLPFSPITQTNINVQAGQNTVATSISF